MKLPTILRTVALLVLLFWIFIFFAGEIQRHWIELSGSHLEIYWQYILLGVFFVILAYLVATFAWQKAILLSSHKKLTFLESIGLLNISQLTKYLPGKVWSYAIQMHLLSSHSISKTWILSVNVIMLLSLVSSATVIGLGYIVFANTYLSQEIAVTLFIASLLFYVFLVIGGTWSINLLVQLANKFPKIQLVAINVPLSRMVTIHVLYLVSNLFFGLAGYFVAIGIGLPQDLSLIVPIAASMLLSDTIGFFAFVVPGGIGVREGVMYAMLKTAIDIQTCFILPIAFRLVTMTCDLLLGGFAMVLLNSFAKNSHKQLHLIKSGAENEK